MEIWFWAAIVSAICSGFGNFIFKIAAKREYNSEAFSLYGGVVSVLFTLPLALIISGTDVLWLAAGISFVAGLVAAGVGIIKIYAMRFIDTTIYFPLYKLISPTFAILFGVIFFAERFEFIEWLGLGLGLLVPLLLISKAENIRQNNLIAGLILLVFGATLSAVVAALNKYTTILWDDIWWLLFFASLGIALGSLVLLWWKGGLVKVRFVCTYGFSLSEFILSGLRGGIMCGALLFGLYAFLTGGTLAVVHTIQSLYILVPIVLSILVYKEHWNLQKVAAIMLSIAALTLLG